MASVVSKIFAAFSLHRSKSKPWSSSATWMTPPAVHHVVRRVEDPAVGEVLLHPRVLQLVVGRTADDLRGERRHGVVVQGAAERARGVDVEPLGPDQPLGVRGDPHGGVLVGDAAHGILAHVRDHDLGAVLKQVLHQVASDLADARDTDGAAAQRRVAPQVLGGGPHALEDAEGRQDGRVARAAVLGERPVVQRHSRATTSMSAT